ncbi:MAG: tetratricopeptide repeat protein [Acidobacteriota bacterium]
MPVPSFALTQEWSSQPVFVGLEKDKLSPAIATKFAAAAQLFKRRVVDLIPAKARPLGEWGWVLTLILVLPWDGFALAQTKPAQKSDWEAQTRQLVQSGRFREALDLCIRAKQKNPKNARPYFLAGLTLMESGDLSGAASELEEALRLSPDNREYLLFQANVLTRLGQKDKALERLSLFKDASRVASLTPAWMWLLADSYYRADRPDDALRILDVLAKRTPRDAKVDLNRGQALVIKGRLEEAKQAFESSVHKQPTQNAQAFFELGKLLHQLNEIAAAKKALAASVQQDPENPESLYKLALVCLARNEDLEAIDYLERAKSGAEKTPEIYYALGRAYRKTGNLPRAQEYLKKFQESNVSSRRQSDRTRETDKLVVQGEKQLDAGNQPEARRLFQEALSIDPSDWAAHGYLAEMALASPQWREAYPHLVKMEEADPDSVVGNYLMAKYWYLNQDFFQARDYAERARALRPANSELRNLLGKIYVELGRTPEALQEYEEAVRLAPSHQEYKNDLTALKEKLRTQSSPSASGPTRPQP